MSDDNRRFIIPLVFSVAGSMGAFWLSQNLTRVLGNYFPAFDFVEGIQGPIVADVNFILLVLFPILLAEFFVLSLPIAFFMLIGAKIFRLTTYNIDIMEIGEGFDWIRIMKRSVVPALFALSLGELVFGLLQDILFLRPEFQPADASIVYRNLHPLVTFLGGLIALVVSIAVFSPTWLLNDSGIVAHVKSDQLKLRRCPDTVGIGRWYSNLVGGFGILAFPITMFYRYFFLKFQVIPLGVEEVFTSLIWIIGLPVMVMAFIIPLIVLNELTIWQTGGVMRSIARKFGANDVQLEHVKRVQIDEDPEPADSQDSFDPTEQTDTQ
jgi:hypothetical protein